MTPETRTAEFSPCRRYRYTLSIEWDASKERVMFIGLNPSTADETKDDPTVRRCKQFAKDWGYGAMVMTNLFAWRDTDPKKMLVAARALSGRWRTSWPQMEIATRILTTCWLAVVARRLQPAHRRMGQARVTPLPRREGQAPRAQSALPQVEQGWQSTASALSERRPHSDCISGACALRVKPYYEHAGITIYHGDCREILPQLLQKPGSHRNISTV